MHTLMWTFNVPAGMSKAQLIETIAATAHTYEGVPGLVRKYYGVTSDGRSLVGIYLWKSAAAANEFHTADWVAMATRRWGAPPQRQEWETPMVVESAERHSKAGQHRAGSVPHTGGEPLGVAPADFLSGPRTSERPVA